jgi:hypothetical protein
MKFLRNIGIPLGVVMFFTGVEIEGHPHKKAVATVLTIAGALLIVVGYALPLFLMPGPKLERGSRGYLRLGGVADSLRNAQPKLPGK